VAKGGGNIFIIFRAACGKIRERERDKILARNLKVPHKKESESGTERREEW
jgi:hypothetical protein